MMTIQSDARPATVARAAWPGAPLDETDRRIVRELVGSARVSNRQLAERIGVAPSTALVRTQSLIERGVITGFTADVDLGSVGRSVQALVSIMLSTSDRQQITAFTKRMSRLPEVVTTFHTAGAVDYLFHVAVPTTAALRAWVFDNLTVDPIVERIETTLVFDHLPGNAAMLPDDRC
jgi:DNA-binding Lrp family transcriptional regulator